jgi:cyclopropane fatty-acyl-phospholipid synthase-like methyltransferase
MAQDSSRYLFKNHPETCDPEDIWGQVTRTVRGKPPPPEQISKIIDSLMTGLEIKPGDVLLDLCCGNGALTTHVFSACAGGLGVDYSDFLISVAKKRFVKRESEDFVVSDALEYIDAEKRPERFTKVLCYGALQYFPSHAADRLVDGLGRRFPSVSRVLLGQLPDKARMAAFFKDRTPERGEVDNPGTPLGIWRTQSEISDLARSAGWKADCRIMPVDFYASHYRFDAVLTRVNVD